MKFINILPFVTLSTTFVIPDEQVFSSIAIESREGLDSIYDALPTKNHAISELESELSKAVKVSKNALDRVMEYTEDTRNHVLKKAEKSVLEPEHWLKSAYSGCGGHDHHGHHKPNQTVYELINSSKYTTKLAELINGFPDLVQLLNGTAANYTIFAPIDKAFDKVPEDAPKPSKAQIKQLLLYHVSSDFYPAGRVLVTRTIPSSLSEDALGGELQRLSTNIGFRGLTVNFYNRIIAIDIVRHPDIYMLHTF